MSLKDDLQKIIKGEVADDSESLTKYSKDASIFEITPKIIVYPKDSEDIKALITYSTKNKVSLTARSAGTDMSGGAINDGILMDMTKYFNSIEEIGEDSARVQPGVYYRDFEVETLKKGLILPCFTASKDLCTVGGMVSNNSAGERTLKFGQTQNYVKSLKVIFSDGNEYEVKPLDKKGLDKKLAQKNFEGKLYTQIWNLIEENNEIIEKAKPQTHKNSTGYLIWNVWDGTTFDLTKLIVGSQGTLGFVTDIEFNLVKNNPHTSLLVISLNDITNLDKIVNEVLKFSPQAFECFDDETITYALKFLPELKTHFKFNSGLGIDLQFLPEQLQKIAGTLPKLVLLAQFAEETEEEAIKKASQAQKDLAQFKVKTKVLNSDKSAEKYWVIRHESFNMLRHHAEHMRSAPFIDDIIVKPERLPEFLPKLNAIIGKYKKELGPQRFIYTVAGHIGDGNFHIIPLIDIKDESVRAAIPQIEHAVFDLVLQYGGSISAEHNDGLVRGPYLEQVFGEEIYQIFKEIKSIFDPKGILNPHKKTGATFKYSFDHLSKS